MAPNSMISIIAEMISIYCILVSFQRNDDIFSENIGISVTRSSDVAIAVMDRIIIITSVGIAVISWVSGSAPLRMLVLVADDIATINADQKMA